jgi:hypothetical protein
MMQMEITEFGDSTPNVPDQTIAHEISNYYNQIKKHAYLYAASAFIGSSPDPQWKGFSWLTGTYTQKPVVAAVGALKRRPRYKKRRIYPEATYIAPYLPRQGTPDKRPGWFNTIVIHHTATGPKTTPYQIADYHTRVRDWPTIGYPFLLQGGQTYQTAHIMEITHHTGHHNSPSIGIGVVNNHQRRPVSNVVLTRLTDLVLWLADLKPDKPVKLRGHREMFGHESTLCPGDYLMDWITEMRTLHPRFL